MKIGNDICEVKRFSNKEKNFYKKIFTTQEILYAEKFKNYAEHFAGFFCAKESIMKALNSGIEKINMLDVEILHLESGKPFVKLTGTAKAFFDNMLEKNIEISISHTSDFAMAFALIY